MEIQPITEANIAPVWELYQRSVAELDRIPLDWFKFKVLGDPDADPSLSLVALDSGKPVGFMVGVARRTEGGLEGFLKVWATDGSHRDKGIAKSLYQCIEDRLRELGAGGFDKLTAGKIGVGYSRPNYITPGIDAGAYTPAVGFLLRRGFKYIGMNYNMDVPLSGRTFRDPDLEARLAAQGITARRLGKDEADRFISWMPEDGWSPGWQYQVRTASEAEPTAVFIAEKESRYVGFAVYDGVRPGWFGPMGTSEEMRGTGIGSILLFKCLEDMRDKGYPICRICAVGPLYFYSKVIAAVVTRTFWLMEKEL